MAKAEKPKVLEAERLILRDAAGYVRAEIGTNDRHVVSLKLCDDRGSCRAELLVTKDGTSGLQFYDSLGKPRLVLYLDQLEALAASPSISLMDREGRVIAELPAEGADKPPESASPGQNPAAE